MASIYRVLPKHVCGLCQTFDAWIIGSAVYWIADYMEYSPIKNMPALDEYPKDFDIVVSHEDWNLASKWIPKNAVINSCGGFKFNDVGNGQDVEVDVWMDDIGKIAILNKEFSAFHPKTKSFIYKEQL